MQKGKNMIYLYIWLISGLVGYISSLVGWNKEFGRVTLGDAMMHLIIMIWGPFACLYAICIIFGDKVLWGHK